VGTPPAPVTFSANGTNAAKDTTVRFAAAGTYQFRATISDGSLSATSEVSVAVAQALTSITITPASTKIKTGGVRQFTAVANDQFRAPLSTQPPIAWSVASGGGTITAGGLYTAPGAPGSATVRAASGAVQKTAAVSILIPIPVAPTNLVVTQTFAQRIDLRWDDNSNNEGAFAIERSRDGVHFTRIGTVGANVRTFSATGLASDTQYYFRVRAWNSTGYSRYTNVIGARTSLV
jgi:hypothetical protein